LLYLFFDARLICSRSLKKIFIIDEPLLFTIALINKWADSSQDKGLVVFQEYIFLDILGELLIRIQRERIWIVLLSSDLELFKAYLDFTKLAFDLFNRTLVA
jgi:hypothetical protein